MDETVLELINLMKILTLEIGKLEQRVTKLEELHPPKEEKEWL